MALEQHFGDAGGGAEVAGDLEGRVGVEEIQVGAAAPAYRAKQAPEDLVGAVAIGEAGPEIDFPRLAPAGAAVALALLFSGSFPSTAAADRVAIESAIRDLATTFGTEYPAAEIYLERFAALSVDAAAGLDALRREALLANPLLLRQPLLFVVRRQFAPDHHNAETFFQVGEINTRSYHGGSSLKILDVAGGGGMPAYFDNIALEVIGDDNPAWFSGWQNLTWPGRHRRINHRPQRRPRLRQPAQPSRMGAASRSATKQLIRPGHDHRR